MSRLPPLPALLGAVFLTLSTVGAVAAKADPKQAGKEPPASVGNVGGVGKPAKAEKGDAKASKTTASSDKAAAKADPPPASSSPMAELKQSNEKLDKILQK